MRKFLLAATMLALPLAAFAGQPNGLIAAGDLNLALTGAASTAGVQSTQGTKAQSNVAGNGAVIVGAVSGNYTSVETTALGKAGPAGSYTDTTATQVNVGGTVTGGLAINQTGNQRGKTPTQGATGTASGSQNSQASGGAMAGAANANLGGFLTVQKMGGRGGHPTMPIVD